jgi:leader peptidase (prepilin peptidase) / N-methyltransferase
MSAPPTALIAAAAAALASPLLAGWSAALAGGQIVGWWRPRRVSWPRWAIVAVAAVGLTAPAGHGTPLPGWLLLAAGGSVLAIVDMQTHRLPTPLVAGLGSAEAATLTLTAIVQHDPARLAHSLLAAAAVTASWFTLALAAPSPLGLGDVWIAGLTAGLLGWSGWTPVLYGQAAAWLLALPLAGVIALARPATRGRRMPVPLGPAIIAGAIAACWL